MIFEILRAAVFTQICMSQAFILYCLFGMILQIGDL